MSVHNNPVLRSTICMLVLTIVALPAAAQNIFDLDELDDGELLLNLDASEQVNVEQDTLNITMQYTAQGRDSKLIQDEVNRVMRDARDMLGETDNIDYSIQRYHVYMIQQGQSRRDLDNPAWRAQQGVQMHSLNSEALLVVTARLQEAGLTVTNMYYSLSQDKHDEVADSLLDAALEKLQARAQLVAKSLGKNAAELVEVTLNGSQPFNGGRVMMAEARSMDSMSMNVPVAQPGETQVSLMVNARALLSP